MSIGIALLILIATMVIGVPVPLAFIASSAYIVAFGGYDFSFLLPYGFSKVNSIIILTIPLFIMAGSLMDSGGIGKKLVESVEKLVGRIKGGLGIVTIVSCAVFGAISGSSSATLSCIGSIMAPRLKESGYPDGYIGAIIASSGVLGILIPPSMLMILFAWVGNQSVLASFLATLIPGIMLVILFSIITVVTLKKNPNVKVYTREELEERFRLEKEERKRKKEFGALPAILMPVIILGSIYGGILTPTEAAAVSVVYAIPVGLWIYKSLNLSIIKNAFTKAAVTTGVIMIMMISVQMLSRLYIMENLPNQILGILTSISDNKYVILLMVNLFMIILGMLMDDTSATLLATPILLPVVVSIGVNPIHFAAILGVNLGMGNITPPTAPLLYLSARMTNVEVKKMLKPTMILILFAWLPTLLLVTFIPQIALFLPTLMGY